MDSKLTNKKYLAVDTLDFLLKKRMKKLFEIKIIKSDIKALEKSKTKLLNDFKKIEDRIKYEIETNRDLLD